MMPGVTVRMYRGLLGDCFLLRLFKDAKADRGGNADAHVLIDCGILQRVKRESERILAVAKNIHDTCKGTLDLVVVTHEHHDHLCGFGHADDIFLKNGGITIKQLWLGWTEKQCDPQADTLRADFKQARLAIVGAAQRLRLRMGAKDKDDWHSEGPLNGLEGFLGPLDEFGVKGRRTGREILRDLQKRAGKTVCHEPGTVAMLPDPVPLRTYVLGPPRDAGFLMKDLPTPGVDKETYLTAKGKGRKAFLKAQGEQTHMLAASGTATGFGAAGGESFPFGRRHSRIPDTNLLDPHVTLPDSHAALSDIRARYFKEETRRIDSDWEGPIGELALKLDKATNNTSLVLAFELSPHGDILLFAADAQVGNWLSWHKHKFDDGAGGTVDAETLLNRTLLYKVGHHGSHNATLKAQGLEMMTHPGLTAMISVVEAEANLRKGWHMPFQYMYDELERRTEGRILRGDAPTPTPTKWLPGRVRDSRETQVGPDGAKAPLWVEFDAS